MQLKVKMVEYLLPPWLKVTSPSQKVIIITF